MAKSCSRASESDVTSVTCVWLKDGSSGAVVARVKLRGTSSGLEGPVASPISSVPHFWYLALDREGFFDLSGPKRTLMSFLDQLEDTLEDSTGFESTCQKGEIYECVFLKQY